MNISDIWQFPLRKGNSGSPQDGACLLDAVSWFEYGHLGDHPKCVCPVIATFGRGVNDAMYNEGRQKLRVFIPRLAGTVDPDNELARVEYLAWQGIRVYASFALSIVGMTDLADTLREFDGTFAEAAMAADAAIAMGPDIWAESKASWCIKSGAARTAAIAARAAENAALGRAREAALEATWATADAVTTAVWVDMATDRAALSKVEDMIVETMNGLLAIGRQAEPMPVERMKEAQRTFELAAQT